MTDRFGIGWRPELAAGIFAHLDRIDVLEVIADDYFHTSRGARRALTTLARTKPVFLHGVSLGLASTMPVDPLRLRCMARLVNDVQPERWSEHLAFVRAEEIEIGHLAAPPRNHATISGAVRNLKHATAAVGQPPLIENVATLIDPPGSTQGEAEWIAAIVVASGCELLLDLHNLHANARNFDFDPLAFLDRLPAERIAAIHLAGGRRLPGGRLLDDHLHDVPDAVYDLLAEVGARVMRPLTVILERDGRYPAMDVLLAQLDRARQSLSDGRSAALETHRARAVV